MKRAVLILAFGLAACASEEFGDLRQFVDASGAGLRGKVPPLPAVLAYEPFTYNVFEMPDPFKPRKIEPEKGGEGRGGGRAPDLNRPREPLESYPLESLKMVGTLEQAKVFHVLVKTPDNNVFRARVGNYMGQNFGKITKISEAEVNLTEIVQDSGGDWTERSSSLLLVE